jgi:hypothetical protein
MPPTSREQLVARPDALENGLGFANRCALIGRIVRNGTIVIRIDWAVRGARFNRRVDECERAVGRQPRLDDGQT